MAIYKNINGVAKLFATVNANGGSGGSSGAEPIVFNAHDYISFDRSVPLSGNNSSYYTAIANVYGAITILNVVFSTPNDIELSNFRYFSFNTVGDEKDAMIYPNGTFMADVFVKDDRDNAEIAVTPYAAVIQGISNKNLQCFNYSASQKVKIPSTFNYGSVFIRAIYLNSVEGAT